jgi:hypothetical protein
MTQLKPAVPLTDPRFQYTPSYATDIRITFARIKAQKQLDALRLTLDMEEFLKNDAIDVPSTI